MQALLPFPATPPERPGEPARRLIQMLPFPEISVTLALSIPWIIAFLSSMVHADAFSKRCTQFLLTKNTSNVSCAFVFISALYEYLHSH